MITFSAETISSGNFLGIVDFEFATLTADEAEERLNSFLGNYKIISIDSVDGENVYFWSYNDTTDTYKESVHFCGPIDEMLPVRAALLRHFLRGSSEEVRELFEQALALEAVRVKHIFNLSV